MCGIAGFSLNPAERINASALASALLLGIEERGYHATGAAWNGADDQVWITKAPIAASEFVTHDHVQPDASTAILHTRWATKGSQDNNANNHPIDVRGIVGIHNGVIWNDDALFDRIGADKRIAQVDSEAIFATLLHSGLPTAQALSAVKGSAAVAWLETADPATLHLARISSSPVVIGITDGGSILFASTEKALRQGALAADVWLTKTFHLGEGAYLTMREGTVTDTQYLAAAERRELTAVERRALNIA